MNWREAFLRQARSENAIRGRLNDPAVAYSHRLHYLQMVAEKLAKGLQTSPTETDDPAPTHQSFVRLLQLLKSWAHVRKQLGYRDAALFRSFIDSLLPLAQKIERLAPSAAGMTRPNPEYPWRDPVTQEVWAPIDYAFAEFDVNDPRMVKLESLLNRLLRVAT